MLNVKLNLLSAFCIFANVSFANPPEPPVTLMGALRQEVQTPNGLESREIIPNGSETLWVVALAKDRPEVGAIAVAEFKAASGSDKILLRIQRDAGSGEDPRVKDYFVRANETVHFEVWYWPNGFEKARAPVKFQVKEGNYRVPGSFGGVISKSFTVTIPNGASPIGTANDYDLWIAQLANLPEGWDVDQDADPDGDGYTNHEEWIYGFDITQRDSFRLVATLQPDNDLNRDYAKIEFGPVRTGRIYEIYRSTDLPVKVDSMTPIKIFNSSGNMEKMTHNDSFEPDNSLFWQIVIKIDSNQ